MGPYPGELSTEEGKQLLTDVAGMGPSVIIMTGGEPLLREDILELTEYGHQLGHRMVMAVNGTLLTPEIARRLQRGWYPAPEHLPGRGHGSQPR